MVDLHRHDLRAKAIGGNFEAQQSAGRVLEKALTMVSPSSR